MRSNLNKMHESRKKFGRSFGSVNTSDILLARPQKRGGTPIILRFLREYADWLAGWGLV